MPKRIHAASMIWSVAVHLPVNIQGKSMSVPEISGPITGGKRGWPFGAAYQDVASIGYVENEYFFGGQATRYQAKPGTELGRDGFWEAESAGTDAFKSRMLVYTPADPARFNGTVIVTWNNVTAGHDLFGADSEEVFEGGFALVCVTTQKAGIDGLAPIHQGLANWDPERYGSLRMSSDDYSFDVFSQAAKAVGPKRDTTAIDPMLGLSVKRLVAQGASQSAGRLGTYVNAIAPIDNPFDAFILTIYFGRGTPLEVGETVVNINQPADSVPVQRRLQGSNLLRTDLAVPILVVNSELEAIACHGVRQPNTDTMRFWETAGTCHVSQQGRTARQRLIERDELVARDIEPNINAIPMNPIYDSSYFHMQRWLNDGTPPPIFEAIAFTGDPAEVVRDGEGIAVGGIRLPQADVPVAKNSAIPVTDDIFGVLGGSSYAFTVAQNVVLHGDRATFLARFRAAADAAVTADAIRPREVEKLVTEAGEMWDKAT